MTSITGTSSTDSTTSSTSSTSTSSTSTDSTASVLGSSMTQADFLKLLTAQLQAQDPTNPVDNSQFVSQMAQFSTLSATQDLNTSLTSLSSDLTSSMQTSQVLSSASLVGRDVMVPATSATYDGSTAVAGAASVTSAGDVQVVIKDAAGDVVRTLDLGTQSAGLSQFSWDGKDDAGDAVAAGTYSISATGSGSTDALSTYVSGEVTGVGYGGTDVGTYVQVAGIGGVSLSQVAQIN